MAEGKNQAARAGESKRITQLETRIQALAIALSANGISLSEGADPIETAIGAIKRSAEAEATFTKIKQELARADGYAKELQTRLDALGTPATDKAELEQLRKRVAELEHENLELEVDLEEVTNEKNRLANELADKPRRPEPAAEEPKPGDRLSQAVEIEERPIGARDAGPRVTPQEKVVRQLVEAGAEFELVFSNGEFEIVDFSVPPIVIQASGLDRVDATRHVVSKALYIKGGSAEHRLHGAALLQGNKVVSYCAFDPVITVRPDEERKFDRALIFG